MKVLLRSLSFILVLASLAYFVVIGGAGCAQIIPPTGGPKDTIPPVLLTALPANHNTQFTDNKIVLTFDEYIQVDKPEDNLIVSPVPKNMPIVETKLRQVTIRIKDTLEENTTYSINFGRSLKDLNEGNPAQHLTYVFSTGSYLDSAFLKGKVEVAETGRPDSTLVVLLYRTEDMIEDSVVAKEKPRYFTRLDSAGQFSFSYLQPGSYHVFALKDQGGQRTYSRTSDMFAFYDQPVEISTSTNIQPVLYAFEAVEEEEKKKPATGTPSRQQGRAAPKKDNHISMTTNLEGGQQDLLSDLILTFNKQLVDFDPDKLFLTDTLFNPIDDYAITPDSTGKVFTITYPWQEGQFFKLLVAEDAVSDSAGNHLAKTDTISFKTKEHKDYGELKVRLENLDTSQHIVLLFYKSDKLDFSHVVTGRDIHYNLFKPGEYDLRLLYDTNLNGKWDTGDYYKKIQPEKIVSTNTRQTVRANWVNELTIDLPAKPPPDTMN